MARSIFAGDTSWDAQPLSEVISDLKSMIQYSQDIANWIEQHEKDAVARKQWNFVPDELQDYAFKCRMLAETVVEFSEIVQALNNKSLNLQHVERVFKAGQFGYQYNLGMGRIEYARKYFVHYDSRLSNLSEKEKIWLERFYTDCRDYFVSVMDLMNMASRLRDFVNPVGASMTTVQVTLGNGTVFQGDFVVASKIQNSFNKAQDAVKEDELSQQLKALAAAVAKMSEELADKDAKEVADNLEVLVDEAASQTPRKRWYQFSVDGLIEAANKVGAVGKPVIEIANSVIGLLENTTP